MLATIAGLVVAIPSVFGYNLLLGHTRRMITELENYASALADRIELEMH
jgi:biopolymer transport protein TolQ